MSIVHSLLLRTHAHHLSYYSNKENLFSLFLSKINRKPKGLEKIITPSTKEYIISLLKKNNIYKKSGASLMVKCLLITFNELDENKLKEIYKVASRTKDNDNMNPESEINMCLNTIVSNEIKEILTNQYEVSPNNVSEIYTRIRLVYTFWARRYREGNKDFTYNLLKEIHENISQEEFILIQ